MEKHIEENPNNIDRDEEIRINKNDIKKKTWSKNGFVSLEEIPEKELSDEETTERAESDNAEDYYDRVVKEEASDDERAQEFNKRRIEILSKELKYREAEGVASVNVEDAEDNHPSHKPINWSIDEKPLKEDEFVRIEKENLPRISRRKTGKQITSMSPEQITRESRSEIKNKRVIRSHSRNSGNTGIEKDNLKTMPDFKKVKNWRQKIKDFFTKQNNEKTIDHKVEQMFEYPFDREDEDPTLNDRPMDKRFLDDENKAA